MAIITMMINEIAREMVSEAFENDSEYFVLSDKERIIDSISSDIRSGLDVCVLDIFSRQEEILDERRLELIKHIIKNGLAIGDEFDGVNSRNRAVVLPCQSGSKYKVTFFDTKSIYGHKSSNDLSVIAKAIIDEGITRKAERKEFEHRCENGDFLNLTVNLADKRKFSFN
ncbi:hypothetical protein QTV49_003917 [Vibrio vulnificus]|nr:hypothetical protein [Vibrio vulnificus]